MDQDVEEEDDDDFVYDVYYRDLRPREVQEADVSMKRIGELYVSPVLVIYQRP